MGRRNDDMLKKCPACNSTKLNVNPGFGFRCRNCGYEHKIIK